MIGNAHTNDDAGPLPRVDCHAHAFLRSLAPAEDRRYMPDYDAPIQDLLAQLRANGLNRVLLVQPSFLQTSCYLLHCLRKHPSQVRGVVASLSPSYVRRRLDEWDAAGVKGLRLNLIGRSAPPLGNRAWSGLFRRLAQHGWHVEVQGVRKHWDEVAPQLSRLPCQVVIDHGGRPDSTDDQEVVLGLARQSHVWVKISAPYRTTSGVLGELLDRFMHEVGRDRLVWGSDWPFTRFEQGRTYAGELNWCRGILGPDFNSLVAENPARLLQWG